MALAAAVRIEIAGQRVPDFLHIWISQQVYGLQKFCVTCRMDTFEEPDDFIISKAKKFIGSTIVLEIDALHPGGDGSEPGLFFKGIISSVKAVKSDLSNEDQIVLIGYSPEFLLDDHPGCRSFENKTLKQIVEEVLKPCPRDVLSAKVNPVWTETIPWCVQYHETNLEFLRRLATRYGEWMVYNGKELVFGTPSGNKEQLILGEDLNTLDFSLNLKAPGFKYVSYDYMSAKKVETDTGKTMGKSQLNEAGKYAFDQSAKRFSFVPVQDYPHLSVAPDRYSKAQKDAIETDASAKAMEMCGIHASSECLKLIPGTKVQVKARKTEARGTVDYGEYLVNEIEHRCDNLLNYENNFSGVPSDAKIPVYADPMAFPRSGPQNALVKDNKDPEKLGRVRVNFFWQESHLMSPWIRIAWPYAANERGFYFIPEIEDEVLVDFEGEDAEKPFVVGSMYHGKNKPPKKWPDNKNSFKGIVTKNNLRIEFDDEKKITTIDTPGGNKVVISDDEKSILLSDQNRNTVELKPSGITLDSPKDIKITSKSKITIDATAGVDISSVADVKVTGLNISQTANVSFTAKGNASAELSAAGATTVKGAMVMIN
jgi:type VI secretion system secreted protein VgrG